MEDNNETKQNNNQDNNPFLLDVNQNGQNPEKNPFHSDISNKYRNSNLRDSLLSNNNNLSQFNMGEDQANNFRFSNLSENSMIGKPQDQSMNNFQNNSFFNNQNDEFGNSKRFDQSFLRDSNLSNDNNNQRINQSLNDSNLEHPSFGQSMLKDNSELRQNQVINDQFMGEFSNMSQNNNQFQRNFGSDIKPNKNEFTLSNSQISQDNRNSLLKSRISEIKEDNTNNQRFSSQNGRFPSDFRSDNISEIRPPSDFQNYGIQDSKSNFSSEYPKPYTDSRITDLSQSKLAVGGNQNNNASGSAAGNNGNEFRSQVVDPMRSKIATDKKFYSEKFDGTQNYMRNTSHIKEEVEEMSSEQIPEQEQNKEADSPRFGNNNEKLMSTSKLGGGFVNPYQQQDEQSLNIRNSDQFQYDPDKAANNQISDRDMQKLMQQFGTGGAQNISITKQDQQLSSIHTSNQLQSSRIGVASSQGQEKNSEFTGLDSSSHPYHSSKLESNTEDFNQLSMFGMTQSQLKVHSNKENRDSIQSRGKSWGAPMMFEQMDNRDSLESVYNQIQKDQKDSFNFSQIKQEGRLSIQPIIQNQALNRNSERLSNQSFVNRNSYNRPSINNRMSNTSNQRLSFQSFNIDGNNNTIPSISNRTSHQTIQEENEEQQLPGCTCTKTKCLKMYCICFQNKRECGPTCRCIDCHNTVQYEQQRQHAVRQILQRNPEAFSNKIDVVGKNKSLFQKPEANKNIFNNSIIQKQSELQSSILQSSKVMESEGGGTQQQNMVYKKGCNCRRTHCLKKYCECFNAGVKCHALCKCDNCKNTEQESSQMELEDNRAQNLMLIEQKYTRQKMFQSLSIEEQRLLMEKQEKAKQEIIGRGIVD